MKEPEIELLIALVALRGESEMSGAGCGWFQVLVFENSIYIICLSFGLTERLIQDAKGVDCFVAAIGYRSTILIGLFVRTPVISSIASVQEKGRSVAYITFQLIYDLRNLRRKAR